MTRPTALYRFYDADDDLLYVGISHNPWTRWSQHKGDKAWAMDVTHQTIEWFETREEALEAERCAIIDEDPTYNVVHARKRRRTGVARIGITCSACGAPIDDGDGWVECDWRAASKRSALPTPYMGEGPLRQVDLSRLLSDEYEMVRWVAWHTWCDPDPEADTYWFAVERCRTMAALLDWTAHLYDKEWVEGSNWFEEIQRAAHGTGSLFNLPPEALGGTE